MTANRSQANVANVPRNPPPEFPVRTYPSPDISDQVLIESVTSELANSKPIAPGTAHENTRDFPGFKLGKQVVNPTDQNFTIRYWVRDQPSPDTFSPAWNYAIKYVSESNAHPVLIRAYRVPKQGYTPLVKGTALADFPAAVLVSEEAQQFPQDSEFYASYFNVVRVYKTLPGPGLTEKSVGAVDHTPNKYKRFVQRTSTVTTPVNPATALPTLSGTQSFASVKQDSVAEATQTIETLVIDASAIPLAGQQLGPFGTETTAESYVADGTAIDTGLGVIESVVSPDGTGKSEKKTVNYPASITSRSLVEKSVGVPILIPEKFRRQVQQTDTRTKVAAGTALPSLSGTQSHIKIADETQDRAEKTVTTLVIDTDTDPLAGQTYDEQYDVPVPFIERIETSGTSIGVNRRTVTPNGDGTDLVRTVDPSTLAAVFASYLLSYPGVANIQLPDVLTSLAAVTSSGASDGSYSETASGSGSGDTFFLSHSAQGTAQGSASISPDLIVEIKQYWGRNVPTTNYFFFLPVPITSADIIAKLLALGVTVSAWPKFILQAHTVILKGSKISAEARGKSAAQVSSSGTSFSTSGTHGSGTSVDRSTNIRAVRIPPCIHGPITIDTSGFSASAGFHVQVVANGAISILGGTVGTDVDTGSLAYSATSSITPGSFSATSVTAVPTSGKYILRVQVDPYKYGYARCAVEVVDAADIS